MARFRTLTIAAAAALAVVTLTAAPAFADNGGRGGDNVVRAALIGSTPAPVSPVIACISPGGAPWVNDPSSARVRDDGRTDVRIRGLIISTSGTNPIASVVATLVCSNVVAGSTDPFALSPTGDGSTRDVVTVPSECNHGIVLIQPAANRAVYIASTLS